MIFPKKTSIDSASKKLPRLILRRNLGRSRSRALSAPLCQGCWDFGLIGGAWSFPRGWCHSNPSQESKICKRLVWRRLRNLPWNKWGFCRDSTDSTNKMGIITNKTWDMIGGFKHSKAHPLDWFCWTWADEDSSALPFSNLSVQVDIASWWFSLD